MNASDRPENDSTPFPHADVDRVLSQLKEIHSDILAQYSAALDEYKSIEQLNK